MCFSATASFVAGGALSAAGAVTLREAKTRPHLLPIAAVPLLFGVQQVVEGVVWVSAAQPWFHSAAVFAYVMFSHVLWPTYLPFAIMSAEPSPRRKSVLGGFVVLGAGLSLWLFSHLASGPVTATHAARGIVYAMNLPAVPYGFAAYVFVTCVACFVSSRKFIRVLGFASVGALAIALWAYREAFYSVWCFFAAILSLIIYAHLRDERAPARRP